MLLPFRKGGAKTQTGTCDLWLPIRPLAQRGLVVLRLHRNVVRHVPVRAVHPPGINRAPSALFVDALEPQSAVRPLGGRVDLQSAVRPLVQVSRALSALSADRKAG